MFENVDGRTDDGVTGKLIAHLGAFGSGELKRVNMFNKHLPSIDSPFLTDDVASLKCITEPPSLCMAAVKEQLVLVLTS